MDNTRSRLLVSPEWLAEHLNDPDVVVVDARLTPVGTSSEPNPKAQYRSGHIPGAVFFDINAVSDAGSDLPHMLPSAATFSLLMEELGVRSDMRIVVYDGDSLFSAPRVWWTFRIFGVADVVILDGGLKAWGDEGHPIEAGEVKRPATEFAANFNPAGVSDFHEVLQALNDSSPQVLDARAADRFKGITAEPRPGLRAGHMPGSINIPYSELVRDGRLKSAHELHRLFKERQVDLDRPIITSCGSGVTAAVLTFGLATIDVQSAIYDGSWSEWGKRPDAPVAVDTQVKALSGV